MTIKTGDTVVLLRDIDRAEGPYAKQGERGRVLEVFQVASSGARQPAVRHAKVQMQDVIKTFRLTSLALEAHVDAVDHRGRPNRP